MSKYVEGINEERFDQFLKDLRSGDFAQGKHALENRGGELCCLGVACVRPAEEGVIERNLTTYGSVSYDGVTTSLPMTVAEYLGIPKTNWANPGDNETDVAFLKLGYNTQNAHGRGQTAIGFNDKQGKSFAEIADAFEKEFTRE